MSGGPEACAAGNRATLAGSPQGNTHGSYLFTGGQFLDPRRDELTGGIEVLVEDTWSRKSPIARSPRPPPNASTSAPAR